MKKKILFIILSVLIITGLTACSAASENTVAPTESTVTTTAAAETGTETESTTEKETTESAEKQSSNADTTARPAEQKSAGQTTTNKVTTTQKSTTTERQTVAKKVTTTQKPTTTKKVTTTAAPYWCDEGGTHHIVDVGPIGWCNSFDEATDKALEYIAAHDASGNFRVKQCYGCGKYTASVTLD